MAEPLPTDTQAALAVLAERIGHVADDVIEVKGSMATKEGQSGLNDMVKGLVQALADERAARIEAVSDARAAAEKALAEEKAEREKVATRLQLVEDRLEGRKFQSLIGIALGALGVVLGIVSRFIVPTS